MKGCGAKVEYYDPHIPFYNYKGDVFKGLATIDPNMVQGYDLVMVTANHTSVDYEMIQENAKAIFDTKNTMKKVKNREKIEVL